MTARSLQEALNTISDSLEIKHALAISPLFSRWSEIVGQKVARVTHPLAVRDGVLSVSVHNNAWAQQLSLLAPRIITAANEAIGTQTITRLRFHVSGTLWSPREPQQPAQEPAPPSAQAPELSLAGVNDPELRHAFARMYDKYVGAVFARCGDRRCICGAPLPVGMKSCPACRLQEQDQAVARWMSELRRDPLLLFREREKTGGNDSSLAAASALLEMELMTAVKVAQTNLGRGQEISPRVRESIETLIILRTGRTAQELSKDELASTVGHDVATTMTRR